MGFDEFKSEIINNAKNQAKKIIDEAEQEKQKINDYTSDRIKELKTSVEEEKKNYLENYKLNLMIDLNSLQNKLKLAMQSSILEKVFENSKQELKNLNLKKREQHINKILTSFKEYKKISCSDKDYSLLKKYNPKKINILGGLILEDDKSETRMNLSYDEILNEIKKQKIGDIAKILFD